jgi:thiosulfate/3-mercaptopyruvate sulfurtransferase
MSSENKNTPYTALIDVQTLAEHLTAPDWIIVDCRFNLADTAAGERAYQEAHIPGQFMLIWIVI